MPLRFFRAGKQLFPRYRQIKRTEAGPGRYPDGLRYYQKKEIGFTITLHEPTHVAEVLAMGQVGILREHAVRNLKAACILQLMVQLEGIEVALFLHYLERLYGVDVLLAVLPV